MGTRTGRRYRRIGTAQAVRAAVTAAIGSRVETLTLRATPPQGARIDGPRSAAAHPAIARIADLGREEMVAVALNGRNAPIGSWTVGAGAVAECAVSPAQVYGPALTLGGCAAVVVAHNHPSGDTSPSPDDLQVAKRMQAAGQVIGIACLDFLIVGAGGGIWSAKEHGVI